TVDRLDQADGADLDDVLHRLVARAEARRGVPHEWEVQFDQGVPDIGALGAVLVERGEPQEQGAGQGAGVDGRRVREAGRRLGRKGRYVSDGAECVEGTGSRVALRGREHLRAALFYGHATPFGSRDGRGRRSPSRGTQPSPEYRSRSSGKRSSRRMSHVGNALK